MKALFLKLLEPFPVKGPIQLRRDDFGELRRLAERHGVLMLLHKRLTEHKMVIGPEEEMARFLEGLSAVRYTTIARSIRQEDVASGISELLNRQGIPSVVFRGNAVACELYRAPYCRVSSDIDLLIKKTDMLAADSVLSGVGYRRGDALPLKFWVNRIHHAAYVHPKTHDLVEIHWNFGIPSFFSLISQDIWEEISPDESGQPNCSPTMTVIQLLIHHHMHAFRELKILVDLLWIFHTYDNVIDWRAFAGRLREIGLGRAALIALAQMGALWEDVDREMTCIRILRRSLHEMGYGVPKYLLSFFRMEIGKDYLFQAPKDKLMARMALDGPRRILLSFLKTAFPAPKEIKEFYGDTRNWTLPFNYSRFISWRLTEWKG